MTARQERVFFRTLHMVLSIPILGYIYGPVAHIPQATWFTRWVAMPLVISSGLWLWLKPRIQRCLRFVPGCRDESPTQRAAASRPLLPAARSAELPPPVEMARPADESARV
jgi:hypothetical protein